MQEQKEGTRARIAYASETLTEAEKRYSQIEKEGLAITWACERFEQYPSVRLKAFILETDHKPLLPIMNGKDINQCPPRLQRLKIRLTRFHYHVQYVPRKDLTVADALSRCPMGNTGNNMANNIETYISAVTLAGIPASDALLADIRQATEKDAQLSKILEYIRERWPNSKNTNGTDCTSVFELLAYFSFVNGVLLRGDQILMPKKLQKEMLNKAYEGHLGAAKSKARARERIWWQGMNKAIDDMIDRCEVCAQFRHQQKENP